MSCFGYDCIAYEAEDKQTDCVPIITLEVISQDSESYTPSQDYSSSNTLYYEDRTEMKPEQTSRYVNGENLKLEPQSENEDNSELLSADASRSRSDLLEYTSRSDGSVVCKLCGEILLSRTHWYRHKYKFHVMQTLSPAPLYQCGQCRVYFKSRKGYIGHVASRHLEDTLPESPPPPSPARVVITPVRVKLEPPDPTPPRAASRRISRNSRSEGGGGGATRERSPESAERRSREEKLVSDIIDRVRRECEAAGAGGPTRRGYTRRTTVMNT